MSHPKYVLGIESSCDEMAAAVVRDATQIVSSVVHGQAAVHQPYGGVVPELASRDHVHHVSAVVASALRQAKLGPERLGGVAVTALIRRTTRMESARTAVTIFAPRGRCPECGHEAPRKRLRGHMRKPTC